LPGLAGWDRTSESSTSTSTRRRRRRRRKRRNKSEARETMWRVGSLWNKIA
jgi:hypothetical protein